MATLNKKRGIKPASTGRAGGRKGIPPPKDSSAEAGEADSTMATFLPFCPHCEKQIIVPNTSILYCSEKCRKQDTKRPTSINLASTSCPSFNNNWTTPPLTSPHMNQMSYFEGAPMKNIVTPSSPTPQRLTPVFGGIDEMVPIPPVGESTSTGSGPRSSGLQRSFSSGYSSGGYSPIDSTPSSPTSIYSNIYNPARGRGNQFRSIAGGSGTSSPTSPGPTYQRPSPPLLRTHSTYSASSKSIDLVTPINTEPEPAPAKHTTPQSPSSPTCSELLYETTWIIPKSNKMDGTGLKTMFNFDKIRGASPISPIGPPRVTATGMYNYNPYAAYRSTQMPIREDAYMQGITTVLRN